MSTTLAREGTTLIERMADQAGPRVERTYWFEGRRGLERAVRDLRAELRSAGFNPVRDTRSLEWDSGTSGLVAMRVEHSTAPGDGPSSYRPVVTVTITGYHSVDWAQLVWLGVEGGFRVATQGPTWHITLTIEANPVPFEEVAR